MTKPLEQAGRGVLLYLRGQEGRGIGLGAKMHAYAVRQPFPSPLPSPALLPFLAPLLKI